MVEPPHQLIEAQINKHPKFRGLGGTIARSQLDKQNKTNKQLSSIERIIFSLKGLILPFGGD